MVRKVTLSVKIQAKVNFEGMGAKPLFAECNKNKEYFIHFNTLKNCDWNDWLKICDGTEIAVTNSEIVKGKTATNVLTSLLVNT